MWGNAGATRPLGCTSVVPGACFVSGAKARSDCGLLLASIRGNWDVEEGRKGQAGAGRPRRGSGRAGAGWLFVRLAVALRGWAAHSQSPLLLEGLELAGVEAASLSGKSYTFQLRDTAAHCAALAPAGG